MGYRSQRRAFLCTFKWRADNTQNRNDVPQAQLTDIIDHSFVPKYKDEVFLKQKYLEEGQSIAQISREIGSSKEAVRHNLKKFNVELREKSKSHGNPAELAYGKKRAKGKVVDHLGELRTIKAIKEMKDSGLGLRAIARALSELGVPTKKRGKKWHPEMVRRLLAKYEV